MEADEQTSGGGADAAMTSAAKNRDMEVIQGDSGWHSLKPPAVALGVLAIVYWLTRAPMVIPGDSAEFVSASVSLGLAHPTGYPLYIVIGKLMSWLFFFVPAATTLNLFSAACCLASLALLAVISRKLRVSALISAAVLVLVGLTPSIWNYSTFAEVYTLHGLMLVAIMWLLVGFPERPSMFRLCLVWALAGVALGNHMTSILMVPGLVVWTVMTIRSSAPRRPLLSVVSIISSYAAGAGVIGLLFFFDRPNAINYINQYAVEISDPRFSDPLSRVLWIVLAQQYGAVSGIGDSLLSLKWLSGIAHVLRTAWTENPALLVIGAAGVISCGAGWKSKSEQRPFFVFVAATALMNILYFATYTKFFEPVFLIHLYLVLALGMAFVLARITRSFRGRVLVVVLLSAVALGQLVTHFVSLDKHGTEIYVLETERLLTNIESDAVVFSTWENSSLIWYFQWVEGKHRDVVVVNAMPHNWLRLAGRFPDRALYFETIPAGQSEQSFCARPPFL